MYNLFLDDDKTPLMCRDYAGDESIYDTEKFTIVKSFDEFYNVIKEKEFLNLYHLILISMETKMALTVQSF